jgi:hypothetical protein
MENETVETVDTQATNTDEVTAKTVIPDKVVKYKIYVDGEGNEVKRVPVGRGRPPKAEVDKDGNFVIRPVVEETKIDTFYITLNTDGTEKSRKIRGRGRPNKDFTLKTDGPFAGHYVKIGTEVKAEETSEATA